MADYFRKTKSLYASTANTFSTGTGVTITPSSVTGLPTDTEITLTFDRVDSSGNSTPTKMERIIGTISSGNFVPRTSPSSGRGADGTSDQAHTSPVVEYIPNAKDMNDQIDGILVEHDQDGTHDASVIAKLAGAQTITGVKDFSVAPKFTFGSEANGDTFYGNASGVITRLAAGTDGQVLTLASGVPSWASGGGTGPSFRATRGASNQAFSASTYVKVQHATEDWDNASAYDNATNYRFTPQTAGYYTVMAQVRMTTLTSGKFCYSVIYKNGSLFAQNEFIAAGTGTQSVLCSAVVYLNGSTDYIEHFIWSDNGTTVISGDISETYFTAKL